MWHDSLDKNVWDVSLKYFSNWDQCYNLPVYGLKLGLRCNHMYELIKIKDQIWQSNWIWIKTGHIIYKN